MRAARLIAPGGPERIVIDDVDPPAAGDGEALVRVHAAAITRDEPEWPVDRLPEGDIRRAPVSDPPCASLA